MSVLASLTGTEVGYYSVVATIIPVFFLAYVVALNKILGQTIAPRGANAAKDYARRLVLTIRNREHWGLHAAGALGAMLLSSVYQLAVMALFGAAVALPSVGEYAALHALYVDRSAHSAKTLGLLGAFIAGLVVIAPVAWTTLKSYTPFSMWGALLEAARNPPEQDPTDEQPAAETPVASPNADPTGPS